MTQTSEDSIDHQQELEEIPYSVRRSLLAREESNQGFPATPEEVDAEHASSQLAWDRYLNGEE